MNQNKEALVYLSGRQFSNSWLFSIPAQKRIIGRNNRLVELAQGKSVIHLGCADHIELNYQENASWLLSSPVTADIGNKAYRYRHQRKGH